MSFLMSSPHPSILNMGMAHLSAGLQTLRGGMTKMMYNNSNNKAYSFISGVSEMSDLDMN